ncbi:EAL domain-containing protein [Lachnoclostridium sp. MSJ-17]|uniref:EAL domain-containing protein n=1 Tax=Lachnoclostridium sp. MSJ-17 TaxID=2841516 RepID=UPI001C104F39|nr:GGDEF domain-containing phosphodiesterase [Lachnoclostridium sp. MSJ-17]MBU5461281.1 EAL domain-containing protein [Lachnoclostridium sp. MSJ-17]
MFHWLSNYNYDFALASVPVQLLLVLFYCFRRNLPIRQSYCFLAVMISNFVMTTADIVSCEMNEVWNDFPLWVMYAINILYFLPFIIRGWALFAYAAEVCRAFQRLGRWFRILTLIPMSFAVILTLSTPWTAAIFTIDPATGYHNCAMYQTIYVSTYFYIGATFFAVIVSWKRLNTRNRTGLVACNTVLLLGIIFRKLFINTLVTSYFSIIVIMIIYLSSENPDLFYERRIGLFNKYAFIRICDDYIEKNIPVNAIMISAHNLETAKHLYGANQIRRQMELVTKRLMGVAAKSYIFYIGSGNFIVLSRETSDAPELTARKWKRQFERQLKTSEEPVPLTFTVMLIPFTILKKELERIDDLLRFSASKSYIENQRGNFTITETTLSNLQRERDIETALKRALEQRRVEVYFQPIYSTENKRVVGAEALARLNDERLGFIPPNEFIRVAEHNGDITELGRQIFDHVCRFVTSEKVEKHGIEFININLSPAQCLDEDLAADLSGIAFNHGVPMKMFDFEITESFIDDHQAILKQMTQLQASGAELSLDDFGTGNSNIAQLLKLPIHVVKLDMSVVHSYFSGESRILPDLIRMFRNADMKIVVEGVETEEMKIRLAEMGCDYEQGFFFSKPVPPQIFLDYLKTA